MVNKQRKTMSTPPGILAFGDIYHKGTTARGQENKPEEWKYQASILFQKEKKDVWQPFFDEVADCIQELKALKKTIENRLPLNDCEELGKDWEGFTDDRYVLKANSKDSRPRVVSTIKVPTDSGDWNYEEIPEESGRIGNGDIVRLAVRFYIYHTTAIGIGCELECVQLLSAGERFTGKSTRVAAEKTFTDDDYDPSEFESAESCLD